MNGVCAYSVIADRPHRVTQGASRRDSCCHDTTCKPARTFRPLLIRESQSRNHAFLTGGLAINTLAHVLTGSLQFFHMSNPGVPSANARRGPMQSVSLELKATLQTNNVAKFSTAIAALHVMVRTARALMRIRRSGVPTRSIKVQASPIMHNLRRG